MKWFHAIGACGKATANVARMFKNMGWYVTGTDTQYLPPASNLLEEAQIPFALNYHFTHLNKEFWEEKLGEKLDIPDHPQLCLIVDTSSKQNKEYLYAKKLGIDVRPFSQLLGEYLVKPESIVIVGSAGKTTTTTLATIVLQKLGLEPSYMIGADVVDIKESIGNFKSRWSVLEGDEFYGVEVSRGAKFLEYKPKYLIITKISWEHQDVFPTQEDYIEEFAKCVRITPKDGLIIAKAGDANIDIALKNSSAKIIRYKYINDIQEVSTNLDEIDTYYITKPSNKFKIYNPQRDLVFEGTTTLFGSYNLENILAVYILLHEVPVLKMQLELQSEDRFLENTFANFKGPKKRLEILLKKENLLVIDDFGVVPERAQNSIKTLKENFPEFEITAIFEPNSGSRPMDLNLFNNEYKDSFKLASEVIIPDLSATNSQLVQTKELVDRLNNLGFNAKYLNENQIQNYLINKVKTVAKKHLFIFFSSYRLTSLAQNVAQSLK